MTPAPSILTKAARPAWQLALFVGGIVVALVYLADLDAKRATAAATEVIRPMRNDLEGHLLETKASRRLMEEYVAEERANRHESITRQRVIARNQYQVCLKLNLQCEAPE